MKVLVTGGLGFIGSFVVDELLVRGDTVTILDNLSPQVHSFTASPPLPSNVKFILGDIRDRKAVEEAIADADAIVHCAAAVGVAQSLYHPHHYVDINVGGTALLLDTLIKQNRRIHKLVLLSSMTVYGEGLYIRPSDEKLFRIEIRDKEQIEKFGWDPVCQSTGETLKPVPIPETSELLAKNVYALTKRYQEELVLNLGNLYGLPVVCLRLFNVYGPRQSLSNPYTGVLAIFLSRLLADQAPVVYEDGNQTRDFVNVYDVVQAIMLALDTPSANGQIFNIGSGEPRRIKDCAVTLAHLLGKENLYPNITKEFRKGDVRHCIADIRKAQRILGYQPRVSWNEGLIEFVQWARQAPSRDRFRQANNELRLYGLVEKLSENRFSKNLR
jgi:dTDP-L-rhamnose 4-epimerase